MTLKRNAEITPTFQRQQAALERKKNSGWEALPKIDSEVLQIILRSMIYDMFCLCYQFQKCKIKVNYLRLKLQIKSSLVLRRLHVWRVLFENAASRLHVCIHTNNLPALALLLRWSCQHNRLLSMLLKKPL